MNTQCRENLTTKIKTKSENIIPLGKKGINFIYVCSVFNGAASNSH
jgi:hypothetical protein